MRVGSSLSLHNLMGRVLPIMEPVAARGSSNPNHVPRFLQACMDSEHSRVDRDKEQGMFARRTGWRACVEHAPRRSHT